MNLRTQEEFVDAVSKEISWRRRELSELRRLIDVSQGEPLRQTAAIRSSVALLYAHWEGFVKRLAEFYLNHVSLQRLRNEELSSCMLAIATRSKLNQAGAAKNIQAHIDLVEHFRSSSSVRARIPFRDVIRTESNLSSSVFSELLATIGLPSTPYKAKYKLIDHQLLARRNSIAHGADLNISASEYEELHEQVSGLITLFKTETENAVFLQQFKKSDTNGGNQSAAS